MKRYEYEKMKKSDVIDVVMALDEYKAKQAVMLKKSNEERDKYKAEAAKVNDKDKEIAKLNTQATNDKRHIESLQKQIGKQKPEDDPRDQMIVKQEKVIKKLAGHIDSLLAAAGDGLTGMRSIVNLTDNAVKNIIAEINQKG